MNTRLIAALLLCVVPLVAPASAQIVDGRTGPGALYRLVRPANWNGRLVLYAHGFVGRSEPVALPAEADLITGLLAPRGFAVAFSSSFQSAAELVQSIITALVGHAGSFASFVPELHGKSYLENLATLYTGALPPSVLAFVNATVGRFDASPSALNAMAHHYEPTGALALPMLMLSTSRDPVVPGLHQAKYQQLVTAAGNGSRLAQRTINRYGHCNFTPDELGAAFLSLVAWVEFGVPPTP